jgi:hypothetical protein
MNISGQATAQWTLKWVGRKSWPALRIAGSAAKSGGGTQRRPIQMPGCRRNSARANPLAHAQRVFVKFGDEEPVIESLAAADPLASS